MSSRYIHHVTLTTGHVVMQRRESVSARALAVAGGILDAMTADPSGTVPIPGLPGYSIGGRISGRCMTATVWVDGPPSETLLSVGIAAHSRCGAPLWRALHDYGSVPVITDRARPPPEPWCGAALEAVAAGAEHREALYVLGGFERCLAWAFVGRHND